MRRSYRNFPRINSEKGAALFIALVLLLILTVLGLSSSNVSIMQERMAGNVAQYNQAFQLAESGLREIESRIYNGICLGGGSGGLGVIPNKQSLGLDPNDCILDGLATPSSDWSLVPDSPQPGGEGWMRYFVAELPPNRCREMASSKEGNPLSGKAFVVLTSGRAPAGQSEAIVQSIVSCVQG